MTKLYKLLDTKNRKEQETRVEQLIQAVQAPVIDLIIRWDGRTNQTSIEVIGGGEVPIQFVYQLLDLTRNQLQEQERQALQQQAGGEMPPGMPPMPPEPVPEAEQPDPAVPEGGDEGELEVSEN